MLNQVILIGRLIEKSELIKKGDTTHIKFKIKTTRSFKNAEGIYENDEFEIIAFGNISENASNYLEKDLIIGIKGRLQNFAGQLQIIAEKITFLTSTHKGE